MFKKHEDNDSIKETQDLMKKVMAFSKLINNLHGRSANDFLCQSLSIEDFEIISTPGEKFFGIIVRFSMETLFEFLKSKTTPKKILRIVNQSLKIIHMEITYFNGRLFSLGLGSYIAVWQFNDDYEAAGIKEADLPSSNSDLKIHLKQRMQAKAEIAFSAIYTAVFKLKIFIREYMHMKHNKINLKAEHIIGFAMHAGTGYIGAAGDDNKVDMIATGADVFITEQISSLNHAYKADMLVTEFLYELLSVEVHLS